MHLSALSRGELRHIAYADPRYETDPLFRALAVAIGCDDYGRPIVEHDARQAPCAAAEVCDVRP